MHAGLDSATLFSIISLLVNVTHAQGLNTTIALLQPPPEVIELFDDLMLMAEGQIVYHVRSPSTSSCSWLRARSSTTCALPKHPHADV